MPERFIPLRVLPNLPVVSKTEESSMDCENDSFFNPEMPDLCSSSEDEETSWAAKIKYPRMRGGGLNDSDEPKVPPLDAGKTISDEMALELQKALARSRKNKTGGSSGTAKNKLQYDKRKQSKLEYDEKIFGLSLPAATQKNKENTMIVSDLDFPATDIKFDYTMSKADKTVQKQKIKADKLKASNEKQKKATSISDLIDPATDIKFDYTTSKADKKVQKQKFKLQNEKEKQADKKVQKEKFKLQNEKEKQADKKVQKQNEKEKQAKLEYDLKIFSLSHAGATYKNKEKTIISLSDLIDDSVEPTKQTDTEIRNQKQKNTEKRKAVHQGIKADKLIAKCKAKEIQKQTNAGERQIISYFKANNRIQTRLKLKQKQRDQIKTIKQTEKARKARNRTMIRYISKLDHMRIKAAAQQQKKKDRARKQDAAVAAERTTTVRDSIRDDMERYHASKQSVRGSDLYFPYDLAWAHTMEHFVHPCLLNNYQHAIGLSQMLHALNMGQNQFDMAAPLPSAADYPAMNQAQWNPYVPSSVRNPFPIRCVTEQPHQSTHAEFDLAANQVVTAELDPMVLLDGEQGGLDYSHSTLRAYLNRNAAVSAENRDAMEEAGGPAPWSDPAMSLMEYTMDFTSQRVVRAIPLTISEAWSEIQSALGPAPAFPSDMPSAITVDWVRLASEFARYFLTVFRPWTRSHPPGDSEERDGADPWGELVHFLRFLSNNAASDALHGSLAFLAAHPLKVSAIGCSDRMILEVEGDASAPEIHAEENKADSEMELDETATPPNRYSTADEDEDDSPLTSSAVSDPVPPDSMVRLERMTSTLGITLPAGCKSRHRQWNLIQECLKLSGAPPQCLEALCYQAQGSRNMLVESFVHLPWLFQREVAQRLDDPTQAFSTAAHALDRLYGVCRPRGVQRPMTADGVLDVDLILETHDALIARAALYLQSTARSNQEIETSIFLVKTSESREWYAPSP